MRFSGSHSAGATGACSSMISSSVSSPDSMSRACHVVLDANDDCELWAVGLLIVCGGIRGG